MKRVALFVGVNKYSNGIQPLSCARNDAEELWSFFRHGAKYDRVEKLVDEQAASADAIRRKIRQMVAGLAHGDLFFLYFSGHGVPCQGRQLLVLSDASYRDVSSGAGKDPPFGTVALDNLVDDTEGDFDRAFLLDMCRAPLQEGQKGLPAGFTSKDLNLLSVAPRRKRQHSLTIMFSCDEKQHAVEITRTGRGLFSLALSSLVRRRMEAGRKVFLDSGFVGAMETEMAHIARDNGIDPDEQRPQLEPHGDPIILVDPYGAPSFPPSVVVCPLCGRNNRTEETFRCLGCGQENLCLSHQDGETFLCTACAAERKRKASAEVLAPAAGCAPPPSSPAAELPRPEQLPEPEREAPRRRKARRPSLAPEAYRISNRVEVEWDWPDGAEAVRLLWRTDRTPVSPEDRLANSVLVRRGQGRGRHTILGCGGVTLHFAAYLAEEGGDALGGAAVFSSVGAADRWSVSYTLKKFRRPWWPAGRSMLRISIRGSGLGMTGLPGFVVLKRAGVQPLHAKDASATPVMTIPPCDRLQEAVEVPLEPGDKGCHVMVYLDGDDSSGLEDRIDWKRPRVSKM